MAGTHRYLLTKAGRQILTAVLQYQHVTLAQLLYLMSISTKLENWRESATTLSALEVAVRNARA